MDEIYELMNQGEANLTEAEKDKVRDMALAAEAYEDAHFPFPPETIPEMVERKRFELHLSTAGLADLLGLGNTKLTQILTGKREPDVPFLKAVYHKPGIDPGDLLDNA